MHAFFVEIFLMKSVYGLKAPSQWPNWCEVFNLGTKVAQIQIAAWLSSWLTNMLLKTRMGLAQA
jgi:hypothetical protein